MYLFCIITNGLHQVNTKSELLEYKSDEAVQNIHRAETDMIVHAF